MTIREGKFLFLAALSILIAAYFSDGHYHADEHHQILEFAASKLGTNQVENLAWEYDERMRPTVQPSMIVAVHHLLRMFDLEDPFRVMRVMRGLSGLLSLIAMWALYFTLRYRFEDHRVRSWFLSLSFLLWVLIYQSVRFSAENWSASLMVLGLVHFMGKRSPSNRDHLIIGMWMGAAFVFRFQTGFFILGYLAWLIFKERTKFSGIFTFALGGLSLSGLGILIDKWFYGEWVFTPYNYFEQNILLDKASGFGVEPWWYYITSTFELGVPPFSILFILAVGIGIFLFRQNVITWTLIPYVLVHFLIGHKEVRFFFPLVVFMPYLIVRSVQWVREEFRPMLLQEKWVKPVVHLFWVWNIGLLLFVSFKPADHDVALWETVYDRYKEPVTIYYNHRSPYGFLLQHNYFKPKELSIQKIKNPEELRKIKGKYVFYTREKDYLSHVGISAELIFNTFPEWVKNFNFNGWLDRTKQDYLFEVN